MKARWIRNSIASASPQTPMYVLLGRAVTEYRWGGSRNILLMRHKFRVLTVKKLLKSVYIYGSYRKIKTGVSLFLDHPVHMQQCPPAAHYCNDVMAAILKVWRHTGNPTQSIDAYLLQEQSRQISSRSDLKRRSLGLFWKGRPNKNNNKMSSDMSSAEKTSVFSESFYVLVYKYDKFRPRKNILYTILSVTSFFFYKL